MTNDMSWVDEAEMNMYNEDRIPPMREVVGGTSIRETKFITNQQIVTLQRLRQQLDLPLMNKRKLHSMTAEVAFQLISDYIQLTRRNK